MIRAFVAAIMAVRTSDTRNITQKIPGMVPFKFDEETAKAPCSFEFSLWQTMGFPTAMGLQPIPIVCRRSTCIFIPALVLPVFRENRRRLDFNQASKSAFSEYEGEKYIQ